MKNYSFVQEALVAEELGSNPYQYHHNLANDYKNRRVKLALKKHISLKAGKIGNLHDRSDPVTHIPMDSFLNRVTARKLAQTQKDVQQRKVNKSVGHQKSKLLAQTGYVRPKKSTPPNDEGYW